MGFKRVLKILWIHRGLLTFPDVKEGNCPGFGFTRSQQACSNPLFLKENKGGSRGSGPVEVYATDPGIFYHKEEGFRRAGSTARRAVRKGLRVDKESILSSLKSKQMNVDYSSRLGTILDESAH